ncbi:hypothetical protein JTB14_000624 [Gonioctena quinquepunctata]|nr:hypothetical protein JTB14_000624 [Gonioctena quinquepunctata]
MNVSPVNTTIEASNDKLSIEQTDNVQPGSCNRTNTAVSKMWTTEKDLEKPVKKRSPFVSSVQNYLKNHVDTDCTPILGDINHNLKELVATEQQKLKSNYFRLQLQYPDVDIERSLTDE